MATYISLLRGVNVGGHKIVMQDLKELYESLNFKRVKTYIQSGNVVFSSNNPNEELKEEIEEAIENVFGLKIPIFIRTKDELQRIIEHNPFPEEESNKIYITFLSDTPVNIPVKEIDEIKEEVEKYYISHKEIYLFLPHGYGRTKLSTNFFENKLMVSATTRNWRTVNKLFDLAK